jgi:hypothetical protein
LVNIYQIIRRNNPEDTQLQMTALWVNSVLERMRKKTVMA